MSDSRFYATDPDDPDAPVVLDEYRGLRPGMSVVYENPAWLQPDGTYKTGGMDGPLVVTEIIGWPSDAEGLGSMMPPQAVLNDGEWEVNADNLRALP